jgi:REP element-mobilizing transposase RayT
MPRRARVFIEGLIYHVYNRVGRGEAPFKLADEADRFVGLLHDVKRRDGLIILAWCLMPNHVHLAVRTSTVPLWRSMRTLQHRYTQAFNRRCRVFGPLWQSRYKARPVTEPTSFLRLLAYIHLNPVTAGMVDDPARYRWSGHRELIRRTPGALIDADAVLGLFGGSRRQARAAYLDLLGQTHGASWLRGALDALPWWGEAPERATASPGLDPLGRSPGPARRRLTADELLARIAPALGVSTQALASPQRAPELLEARELLAALAVERWQVGVKALADALGKSRDGVSLWVQRAAARRQSDPRFAARLDDLDGRLGASVVGGPPPTRQLS